MKAALVRERRLRLAEADIEILKRGESDGFEGLAGYAASVSFADLD